MAAPFPGGLKVATEQGYFFSARENVQYTARPCFQPSPEPVVSHNQLAQRCIQQ